MKKRPAEFSAFHWAGLALGIYLLPMVIFTIDESVLGTFWIMKHFPPWVRYAMGIIYVVPLQWLGLI